ncbi:MAG: hypothetical protein ACREVR_18335, partial [Burkholderiales bacterium]
TFQCDVRLIRSQAGNEHPIISVPPHGAVPICAAAGGPIINGKNKGITLGTYYIRKAGPESAPILTSTEWAPLIRRCAMHERTAILSAIDVALRGAAPAAPAVDALRTWHEAAHTVFLDDIKKYGADPGLAKSHYQYSYAVERAHDEQLARIIHALKGCGVASVA